MQPQPSIHLESREDISIIPSASSQQAGSHLDDRRRQTRARLRKALHTVIQLQSAVEKNGNAGKAHHYDFMNSALAYEGKNTPCQINVVEYGALRLVRRHYNNEEFINFLGETDSAIWRKVRWIDIGGISWDVLRALTMTYDLHPLAISDIIDRRSGDRAWAEIFSHHLFLHVINHVLHNDQRSGDRAAVVTDDEDDESDESILNEKAGNEEGATLPGLKSNDLEMNFNKPPETSETQTNRKATLEWLKGHDRVKVNLTDIFLFVLRDGTLISIRPEKTPIFEAIMQRLRARDSLLRTNPQSSLLLHAILDQLVEEALLIVDRYDSQLAKLEEDVLIQARMRTVRSVRVLASDIRLLKRTLGSMMTVVSDLFQNGNAQSIPNGYRDSLEGFISIKTRMYMGSIKNNLDFVISSLEMFEGSAHDLIDYAIQIIDYEATSMMRCLTIIFFPLTFLTAYFGMNFQMHQVDANTDLYFWKIAAPLIVAVIVIFGSPEVARLIQLMQNTRAIRRIRKRGQDRRTLKGRHKSE